MTKILVPILVLAAGLCGCGEEHRVDVSQKDEFRRLVGMQYEVTGSVDAYGIRSYSRPEVVYVTLIPLPGISGPEVGYRIPLKLGSKVTIRKVIETNRAFDPNMSYEVLLEGTQLPTAVPVRIDLFRGNQGDSPMELNPKLYRSLKASN